MTDDFMARMGAPSARLKAEEARLWISEQHWPHLASRIRDLMGVIHVSSDTVGNVWVCKDADVLYGSWLDEEDLIDLVRRLRDPRYERMRPIR